MEKINLTPHKLDLYNADRKLVVSIPPSGAVARVTVSRTPVGKIDGVPVYRTVHRAVTGLPAPCPGTIYIVSGMVRSHPSLAERKDVYQPGALLRDANGSPVGAIGLNRPPRPQKEK